MWKLPDAVAQRFPLVARPRPVCLPLPERVRTLTDLASTADHARASAVYNQAALIASDLDLPGLARLWCHRHAAAYLHACPLPGGAAIHALEPLVNLARLQIRSGQGDDARRRLLDLYEAVSTGTAARFTDVALPDVLTATAEDRREVRAWLWRVILADGTRTLTGAGRWADALAHLQEHSGIGRRMLDGRQVAVLAALTSGDAHGAGALLADTMPGDPWEQTVTACLTVQCHRALGRPVESLLDELLDTCLVREAVPGLAVFDTQLGLTVLDAMGAEHPAAHRLARHLHRRAMEARDGYAARELLANRPFSGLASSAQAQDCRDLVHACALGSGTLPDDLRTALAGALQRSDGIIRKSLAGSRRAA